MGGWFSKTRLLGSQIGRTTGVVAAESSSNIVRDFCGDWFCIVVRSPATAATGVQDYINDYSHLHFGLLTTNQVVGGSNPSGRAI